MVDCLDGPSATAFTNIQQPGRSAEIDGGPSPGLRSAVVIPSQPMLGCAAPSQTVRKSSATSAGGSPSETVRTPPSGLGVGSKRVSVSQGSADGRSAGALWLLLRLVKRRGASDGRSLVLVVPLESDGVNRIGSCNARKQRSRVRVLFIEFLRRVLGWGSRRSAGQVPTAGAAVRAACGDGGADSVRLRARGRAGKASGWRRVVAARASRSPKTSSVRPSTHGR